MIKTSYFGPSNIELSQLFNIPKTSGTPFFIQNIEPSINTNSHSCLIRIYVSLNTSVNLTLTRTVGDETVLEKLNGGSQLIEGCAYIFDSAISEGESINFVADADVTINKLTLFWVV